MRKQCGEQRVKFFISTGQLYFHLLHLCHLWFKQYIYLSGFSWVRVCRLSCDVKLFWLEVGRNKEVAFEIWGGDCFASSDAAVGLCTSIELVFDALSICVFV
jgi:hypothetical protein